MTRDEMIAQLAEEVPISALSDPTDFENACDDASREIGWAFPVSTDFKILWMKERAKRYLFFYLATQSAHKFKVKQINLNQRFDHYFKIIKYLDEQFKDAQETYVHEFADVSAFEMFAIKIDAGFAYGPTGKDITYDSEQEVIITPDENS